MSELTLATGIAGLDLILCGGLPKQRATVVAGAPGSGKTVLALQFLAHGASACNEPGLFVTFEESPEALQRNWVQMSLDGSEALGNSVRIIDGRFPDGVVDAASFNLDGLLAILTAQVRKLGVKRLAIDGVDTLFAVGATATSRRQELLRLLKWLSEADVTSLLTMKSDDLTGETPHYDFVDFAANGLIQLRFTWCRGLLRRMLRVIKLRGSKFLEGEHAYTLSARGLTVSTYPRQTDIESDKPLSSRLSTGVERLDRMLEGGFVAGSVTLISGLPGTSKTTFAASFMNAGCEAGERVLFIGFDEPSGQVIRNARSVGINLAGFHEAKLLRATSFAAGSVIADEHYIAIEALIDAHCPARIVVDPISALANAGGIDIADSISERLAMLCKERGITAVFTAVSDSRVGELETASSRLVTLADTWIHLSFAANEGERNRTLTIIKSRGTAHSNQLREVLLSNEGVTLADVYTSDGDVLLGTARLRREQAAAVELELVGQRSVIELRTLDEGRDKLYKDLEDLRRRLGEIDHHRASMVSRTAARDDITVADAAALREARFGDPLVKERHDGNGMP